MVSSSVEVPHECGVQYGAVPSLQLRFHEGAHETVVVRTRLLTNSRKWNCHGSSLPAWEADNLQTGTRDGSLSVRSGGRGWCHGVGGGSLAVGQTERLQTGLETMGGDDLPFLGGREEFW